MLSQTVVEKKTGTKIETFELSEKRHPYTPVSTTKILSEYTRDLPPDISESLLQERRRGLREHAATVEDLRRWATHPGRNIVGKYLDFLPGAAPSRPSEKKLLSAVDHFFPPRSDVQVTICDFGDGRAERREVRLGDIEAEFETKPPWSTVRWIHAPLGIGLLHSSVEALFFHTGSKEMGRPFTNGGRAGWPYLEIETFDLRNAKSIQESRDLLRILKDERDISDILDRSVFAGNNSEKLKKDVTWRAQYVGQSVRFWELAKADLPWQIADGSHLNMNGPSEGIRSTKLEKATQSLTRHPFFEDAYIARSAFRSFHRNDGFLLTMSPATGVDYLNANFPHYLELSQKDLSGDNFASATAEVFREFSITGTQTWARKTVEWFLVYLITEVAVTPHNIRQGYSVPSLMDAYDAIVHDLKERRYDLWRKGETTNLVRAYLLCVDELTVLGGIFSKKLDFFRRLRKDCEVLSELRNGETVDLSEFDSGETASDRVAFAEHMMEECSARCKRLGADLRESLNTLFQLRSIEQNELAIIADSKQKAIFVFTAVTIVFLPLSFFTSYFGMNLRGIVDTSYSETYFWKVGGSVSIAIILIVCLLAFRNRIRNRMSAYGLWNGALSA
ncbi:hypothetical protein H2200_011255 [Cladophialophora chaetospira]|uniref:Magnesium transport protein CorA, transmembrane region n=1 Tax=Cladophialophora chaetospira TaxID=386627 RepID=A0AA38X0A2_9EURO|nr:hypothetical protein H2200_011255 [Cladophialophora chaetospira]